MDIHAGFKAVFYGNSLVHNMKDQNKGKSCGANHVA